MLEQVLAELGQVLSLVQVGVTLRLVVMGLGLRVADEEQVGGHTFDGLVLLH